MSMHPFEGALYLSVILVHLILPLHPLHIIFHISWYALGLAARHFAFVPFRFQGANLRVSVIFSISVIIAFLNAIMGILMFLLITSVIPSTTELMKPQKNARTHEKAAQDRTLKNEKCRR